MDINNLEKRLNDISIKKDELNNDLKKYNSSFSRFG